MLESPEPVQPSAHIPLTVDRHATISVPRKLTPKEAEKLKKLIDLFVYVPEVPEYRITGVTI